MRKKKNKKRKGDDPMEIFIKTMEEQTKQIKRLADSKAAGIEDIGRGNRTEDGQDQDLPPTQYDQGYLDGQEEEKRKEEERRKESQGYRPKVCKKLVKGLCSYGLSGFFNGERCPEPHPRPCEGWRQKGKEGCPRGIQCRFYHQPPCQTVTNSTLCDMVYVNLSTYP